MGQQNSDCGARDACVHVHHVLYLHTYKKCIYTCTKSIYSCMYMYVVLYYKHICIVCNAIHFKDVCEHPQ